MLDTMIYEKKIVCLANSRKHNGYCVAGKELISGGYGRWIRPVSDNGALKEEQVKYKNGSKPQMLDVISIEFTKPNPKSHQTENYLINDVLWGHSLERLVEWKELENLKDDPNKLWFNKNSTPHGKHDFVSEEEIAELKNSLYLIYLKSVNITVGKNIKKPNQVRAEFLFKDEDYNLAVTDIKAEEYFKEGKEIKDVYLCISLGGPHSYDNKKSYYKLVAGVIWKPLLKSTY